MKAKKAKGGVNLKWFRGRKDGIKKKTWELSVLCGVKACAIIIGPDGKLETWPENSADVVSVIREFQNSGRSAAVSRKREQGTARIEEKDENFGRFLKDLEEEEEKEEATNHIPNVLEFDEWVNSNWSDRAMDEPKQEKGYMQLLLDEDVDDEVLFSNNPR